MEVRGQIMQSIEKLYPDCRVLDIGRAVILIPPKDGRFGTLPLEVPVPLSPKSLSRSEQMICREVTVNMEGLVRALPDIGQQTLSALRFSERVYGTIWEGTHLEAFLRFGILLKADRAIKMPRSSRMVLKIVPPQYATDMQIILRTRSNNDLSTLVKLLPKAKMKYPAWSYSYARIMGCNHVFGALSISGDFTEIKDQMEDYWRLVNGTWRDGREQRQYVNRWLSGMNFR